MSRWAMAAPAAFVLASCASTRKDAPMTTVAVAEHTAESPGTPADAGPDVAKAALPPGLGDEIRRVVMLHMPEIRLCYESALATVPGLKGSLTVGWHITAAGLVSRSSVVSTSLKYLPVEDCIAQAVRTWVFKNPQAVEADATWGFQFTPP